MFGKRSDSDLETNGRAMTPVQPAHAQPVKAELRPEAAPRVPVKKASEPQKTVASEAPSDDGARTAEYYNVKTTVFNALIDTIDLAQLSQVEKNVAREEIRDIVTEILSIKNVIMSISEQEELLEDICNDVLGYGPLEPLLARDDIADIMINGAHTSFIEVNGKML